MMAPYKKIPVVIDATRWFMNGDHPEDALYDVVMDDGETFKSEGKVVRYFRHPYKDGDRLCTHCENIMHIHGWIDTLEGGHTVCPGDWIITGVDGEYYPCKNRIFKITYEKMEGHE